jgi:evolutionarily conserved signaling intermediate in Toll pathway
MIRCRNCLFSLINQRTKLPLLQSARNLCSSNESQKTEAQDERKQFEREEKHDQFVKRAMILKGSFEQEINKDKTSYLDMIKIFETKDKHRRNHVEFIYAALKNMEDYGVHKDLAVYKALVDVMPKGKFIPTNIFQAEFQHYPKQQQCIIDLLEQMEDNGENELTGE